MHRRGHCRAHARPRTTPRLSGESVESPTRSTIEKTPSVIVRRPFPGVLGTRTRERRAKNVEADGTTTLKLKKSLEPYGQLIKMLLPRAVSIDIFDASGAQRWSSNDLDSFDLQPLVEQ